MEPQEELLQLRQESALWILRSSQGLEELSKLVEILVDLLLAAAKVFGRIEIIAEEVVCPMKGTWSSPLNNADAWLHGHTGTDGDRLTTLKPKRAAFHVCTGEGIFMCM